MIHLAAAGSQSEFKQLSNMRPHDAVKQTLQFVPVLDSPAAPSATQQFARELDFNSVIFAPMIRGDKVIGALSVARREPMPFNEEEITLIKALANQAVIAIENSESLDQQTAGAPI